MKTALINPPLVGYRGDLFASIPAIPVGLLHVAAAVRDAGHEVSVVDAFAAAPSRERKWLDEFGLFGLLPGEAAALVAEDARVVGISAHSGMSHAWCRRFIRIIKTTGATVVAGGPFASTAPRTFLEAGADHVVAGEGEHAFVGLLNRLEAGEKPDAALVPGVFEKDPDRLPWPAFDLVDLAAYWRSGRAHAPVSGPWLPLVTSRGCPHSCAFCAAPALSGRTWRPRSPESVAEEVAVSMPRHKITDFHIQDDNFTVSRSRVLRFCDLVRDLFPSPVFHLPSGVRSADIDEDLLHAMAEAGFRYMAFSPESGSPRIRELMGKPLDEQHLLNLVSVARRLGITTQACFIAGFPDETDKDRRWSMRLIDRLVRAGVHDLSVFIMAPVPGSRCETAFGGLPAPEGMNWSPRWRPDYKRLKRFRRAAYSRYFARMAVSRPVEMIRFCANGARGKYRTKGQMAAGWWLRHFFLANQ
ncbi:MAG: B12-binding domain-containing radical SAM protein [Desulfatibacillaceae bacterium]